MNIVYNRMESIAALILALCVLGFAGCGDDAGGDFETSSSDGDGFNGSNGVSSNGVIATSNGTTATSNGTTSFEPEPEERFNFQAPQPSRNYVYVANTSLDTVARINGDTLEIISIEVGDRPTVVRTSQDTNTAVVLNEGSSDVSVIHSRVEGDSVVHLDIREGFNNIVMSPGGRYALAYLDYETISLEGDVGKFQDVNLIRLEEGNEVVYNIAVGFRVLEIEFDQSGNRAFVITEDGVSILSLDSIDRDFDAQPTPVSDDPFEDAVAVDREIEVTNNGKLALVRSSVLQGLNVISLNVAERDIVHIPMPSVPSDLDIYPDSSRALAVLKDARQVAIIELSNVIDDPESAITYIDVPEGPLGLITLDIASNLALLYSAASQEPSITRLDLETGAQVVWDVRKGVRGVQLSPNSSRAVIFHSNTDSARSNSASDQFIATSWAYTLLDVVTGFTKLQTTPTQAGEFVFSSDNQWMFLALDDPSGLVRQVERVNLESFRVDSYTLASPPAHLGLLPSNARTRIYVSQEHPVGRMTFFEIDSGDARTITGYELNSQID